MDHSRKAESSTTEDSRDGRLAERFVLRPIKSGVGVGGQSGVDYIDGESEGEVSAHINEGEDIPINVHDNYSSEDTPINIHSNYSLEDKQINIYNNYSSEDVPINIHNNYSSEHTPINTPNNYSSEDTPMNIRTNYSSEDTPINIHNNYSSDELLCYEYEDDYNPTMERCKQCSCWIKYTLFTINFFVWVGGVCLVIIGVWARLEKAKLGSFDNLATDPAFFLLAVGIVMFFISIFGCLGSLRENICLLKAFCVVIAVVFVVEVILGILAFFFIEYVRNNLLEFFRGAIYTYQDDSDLKTAVDYIQKRFQCCGAETYNDWELNIYYNCSSPARSRCGVPISCCRVPTNTLCGFHTRIEGEVYAAHTIYTKGCIESLMLIFKDNLIIIGLIAFGVGFVELFAILLAHSLIKEIVIAKKEYNETTRLRMDLHKVYDSTTTP